MTRNVGLRELRQSASEVIRAVEAGEHVTVTVAGRVVAEITPPPAHAWQPATALADIWTGETYGPLDRGAFDDRLSDPFTRTQGPQ
jgi:prevent-host-death family protein